MKLDQAISVVGKMKSKHGGVNTYREVTPLTNYKALVGQFIITMAMLLGIVATALFILF